MATHLSTLFLPPHSKAHVGVRPIDLQLRTAALGSDDLGPHVPVYSAGALPGSAAVGEVPGRRGLDAGDGPGLHAAGRPHRAARRAPGPRGLGVSSPASLPQCPGL